MPTALAFGCCAMGAAAGALAASIRAAARDMAFMLSPNGRSCQRFNLESQLFGHAFGVPKAKQRPPAPQRDRRPWFRKPRRA
ncbi:Tat pathway signal sequence domain protein [Sphingopyxis sp. FD7]|nr:Tat pathway signal sequence domain protein [Sphingopyxis sp. FD7]